MILEPKSDDFPWMPTRSTIHLAIDMQRVFGQGGLWPTPWLETILPKVAEIAEHAPQRTIFTRFIPPARPDEIHGTWQRYYQQWRALTLDHIDPRQLGLMSPLDEIARFARVLDKPVYSAFVGSGLQQLLIESEADALVVTGAETDVCVLATILDAVDLGYPVFVITDAICGSTDRSHDAVLTLYRTRFYQQIQTLTTAQLLDIWPR